MCRRRNFLEEIFSSVAWIFLFTDKSDSTLKTAVIQKSATIEVEYLYYKNWDYQKQTYKHTIFKDKKKRKHETGTKGNNYVTKWGFGRLSDSNLERSYILSVPVKLFLSYVDS